MNARRWAARGMMMTVSCATVTGCCGARATNHDEARVASEGWLIAPTVPAAIQVPAGAAVALRFHARGVQIYACASKTDAQGTSFAWTLKAPEAKLYDAANAEVGLHSAGPTWTLADGSAVKAVKAAQAPSPDANAVPWLLLRVASAPEGSAFAGVTYVQRVRTEHGKAPSDGCSAETVGQESRADYGADYYFFRGGGSAAQTL